MYVSLQRTPWRLVSNWGLKLSLFHYLFVRANKNKTQNKTHCLYIRSFIFYAMKWILLVTERMYFTAKQTRIVFSTEFVRIWNAFVIPYGQVRVLYVSGIISTKINNESNPNVPRGIGIWNFILLGLYVHRIHPIYYKYTWQIIRLLFNRFSRTFYDLNY